jgi:hypothetical protein
MSQNDIDDDVYFLCYKMEKKDILRELYEEKYFDKTPHSKNSRVAPQTPGSKALKIFGFEKQWDIYPEFKDKNVTDVWWWLSNFAFELAPSVQKIIVVDPTYHYDLKECVEEQKQKADNRVMKTNELQSTSGKNLTETLNLEQEVGEWIQKRKENIINPDPKIELNDSFAQDIVWIPDNGQDAVFFNFVLHTLKGAGSLEDEIVSALDNAYRITKPGGKIYGIYDDIRPEEDIILSALNRMEYRRNARHKDNNNYIVFIMDKK